MEGYIYCIHNKMFDQYGENVYKLGYCTDLSSLNSRYCTCYVDKIDVINIKQVKGKVRAESNLFYLLDDYRLKKNREFFKCDIEIIKEKMEIAEEELIIKKMDLESKKNKLLKADKIDDDKAEELKDSSLDENKLILERHEIEKQFKLVDGEFCKDFLDNWYRKEHILDNALKSLGAGDDNLQEKLNYLDQILAVYGFDNILDMNKEVILDDGMRKRMDDSKLTTTEYNKVKNTYGKKMRNKTGRFCVGNFTQNANGILKEFGIKIDSHRKQKRTNGKMTSKFIYKIIEDKSGLTEYIKRHIEEATL